MPPKSISPTRKRSSSTLSSIGQVQSSLLSWYHKNMRSLPWRNKKIVPDFSLTPQYNKLFKVYQKESSNERDVKQDATLLERLHSKIDSVCPYGIWVSEIMSQQTRIDVVVPFWQRWMLRFPDSRALAEASLDEVQKYWSGLGFYRRCDLLHRGAKALNSDEFLKITDKKGCLPTKDVESLKKVPGIGDYTSAAIGSISFDHPDCPAVDGNVLRVTSRVFGMQNMNVKEKKDIQKISEYSKELIKGVKKTGDFNQAMMELGATVCKPNGAPLCDQCPISKFCQARKMLVSKEITDIEGVIPLRSVATEKTLVHAIVCVVYCCSSDNDDGTNSKTKVLIFKRPDASSSASEGRRLLSGFWSFPMISVASAPVNPAKVVNEKYLFQLFSGGLKKQEEKKSQQKTSDGNKDKKKSTQREGPTASFNLTNSYEVLKSLMPTTTKKQNLKIQIEENNLQVRHVFSHIDFTGTVVKIKVANEKVLSDLLLSSSSKKKRNDDVAIVDLEKLRGHHDHAISNLDEKIVNVVFPGNSGRRRQRE